MPHLGGLRTALFNWLLARHTGGQFIYRLEDTDRERYTPEAVEALPAAMAWLGIEPDESPQKGGPHAPYVQSERLHLYREAADRLIATGHAYRCYCTKERLDAMRAAQEAAKAPTGYDRRCRNLSDSERAALEASGAPFVVRFAMPLEGATTFVDAIRGEITFENALLDDFVLLKSDGYPTYQLAAPLDDALMGVTHVVRGEEWISSATKNIHVTRALGFTEPTYAHLPLILGPDKKKLSKRHGATGVAEYAEAGYLPEAMFNFLALLGWSDGSDQEVYSRDELVAKFSLDGVSRSPAVFDIQKLDWLNGVLIRAMSLPELADRTLPFLQKAGLVPDALGEAQRHYVEAVLALFQERVTKLADAPAMTRYFFVDDLESEDKALKRVRAEGAPAVLRKVADRLDALTDWTVASVEAAVRGVIDELGVKSGDVIHPVRAAVTGRTTGAGLFETIEVLGRERSVRRLRSAAG
jgi:glutamyl-tRNA synthetase